MPIYSSYQAQVTSLTNKETRIPTKYSEFSNVFSSDSILELLDYTGINNHPINLLDNKQLPYSPIYNLGPLELKTLKTYIKANLASNFIRRFKSPTVASILFVRKKNSNLRLYADYQELNNFIIKNCYMPSLIGESLNCLGCTKHFTQLHLTNTYH